MLVIRDAHFLPDSYTQTMAQNLTADKSKFDSPPRRDAPDSASAEGGRGGSEAPMDFRNHPLELPVLVTGLHVVMSN
jgi:hypothetical protein